MPDSPEYAKERDRMVHDQVARRGVRDKRVLDALRSVPRHRFVPKEHASQAYYDGPLPIGSGQTISQPYIVGLMSELLELTGGETVLEVGTGSGYQAAILGELARQVHTIERYQALADRARSILVDLGVANVLVHVGDGTNGLPELAPFDAIVVTAAAPRVPKPLLAQLADGGRLVLPVGGWEGQTLEVWRRQGARYDYETILAVAFVPLVGEHGWQSGYWDNTA